MKAHIITKTYDNNATVIDRVFSSRVKAEKWLEKNIETYIADGYQCFWFLRCIPRRGYERAFEILKDGVRKYIYRIESVEME